VTLDAGHPAPNDPLREQAALYALGLLGPDETREFERHLAEGCATCESEVRAYGLAVADLGRTVAPVAPGPSVRERLLARVRAGARELAAIVVRADETGWGAGPAPGITARPLHRDPTTRYVTALVRIAPGASYPAHAHVAPEELYLLAGELRVGDFRLRAGDYCAGDPGSRHAASLSPEGCTFIVHASLDDRLGDEAPASRAGIVIVHASNTAWEPGPAAGVRTRLLRESAEHGARTSLVRMAPGAVLPAGRRPAEQIYVLEGDGAIAGEVLSAGDYCRTAAGLAPQASTRSGCTLLVISAGREGLA